MIGEYPGFSQFTHHNLSGLEETVPVQAPIIWPWDSVASLVLRPSHQCNGCIRKKRGCQVISRSKLFSVTKTIEVTVADRGHPLPIALVDSGRPDPGPLELAELGAIDSVTRRAASGILLAASPTSLTSFRSSLPWPLLQLPEVEWFVMWSFVKAASWIHPCCLAHDVFFDYEHLNKDLDEELDECPPPRDLRCRFCCGRASCCPQNDWERSVDLKGWLDAISIFCVQLQSMPVTTVESLCWNCCFMIDMLVLYTYF